MKVMKAIIYRHNTQLADYAQNSNFEFVHEFPANLYVEEIAKQLPAVAKILEDKFGEYAYDVTCVDGTVHLAASAVGEERSGGLDSSLVIKQDNDSCYNLHAESVAASVRATGFAVILVSKCIAHHNSESESEDIDLDEVRDEQWRVDEVIQKWTTRLHAYGIKPTVVDRLYEEDGSISISIGDLSNKIIVVDHHHDCGEEVIEAGGIIFNAYPSFKVRSA